MRKKTIILLSLLLSSPYAAFAKKDGMAHFSGVIKDYHQGSLVTIVDPQGKIADDTLAMGNDGRFKTAIKVDNATELLFNIEQPQASFKLYATPNSNAELEISVEAKEKAEENKTSVNYTGANKEVFDFIQTHDFNNLIGSEKYSIEKLKSMSFSEYKSALTADVEQMKNDLAPLKDKVFKASKKAEWDRKLRDGLFRYTEVEIKEDEDYTNWMLAMDYNHDLDIATLGMARYYNLSQHKGNNDFEIRFIRELPRRFESEEMYLTCLNNHMLTVFAKAPVNIDEIYATYKKHYAGHENDIPDFVKAGYEEAKRNVAGKTAPDFEMEDINGNKLTLSSLQGKLLYIDVWATWCGPCKLELPKMKTLAEHYKDDANVLLVSISIDQDFDRWKETISKSEQISNWSQYHVTGALESDFCKRYNVVGIPRFLIIDRNGKVVSLDAPRPGEASTIELIDQQ